MTGDVVTTELPADIGSTIRTVKAQLRGQIGDVAAAFDEVAEAMRAEVGSVLAERDAGQPVWPIVRFGDIADDRVPAATVEAIRRRGCVVVKGTFPRQRAEEWDAALASYTYENHFSETYRAIDDGVFGGLAARKPSIFPIYWSKPQIQARQDDNMVAVRGFLNSFWRHESEGRVWFDPTRDTAYPDRVRRRPPGATSRGLSPHTDSGSVERWLLPAYQRVFRHIYSGQWSKYDPWDGAYRTEVHEYRSTVMSSALRTFQGWTALSDMQPGEGVLHTIPIPAAMAYVLLRALQDDRRRRPVRGGEWPGHSRRRSLPLRACDNVHRWRDGRRRHLREPARIRTYPSTAHRSRPPFRNLAMVAAHSSVCDSNIR